MKLAIKSIEFGNGIDPDNFFPDIIDNFQFSVWMRIGPLDVETSVDFEVMIRTPRNLDHAIQNSGPISGRHMIIVNEYDKDAIVDVLNCLLIESHRENFDETYEVLSRHFKSEFEDYVE